METKKRTSGAILRRPRGLVLTSTIGSAKRFSVRLAGDVRNASDSNQKGYGLPNCNYRSSLALVVLCCGCLQSNCEYDYERAIFALARETPRSVHCSVKTVQCDLLQCITILHIYIFMSYCLLCFPQCRYHFRSYKIISETGFVFSAFDKYTNPNIYIYIYVIVRIF